MALGQIRIFLNQIVEFTCSADRMKKSKIVSNIKKLIAKGELSEAIRFAMQFLGNKDFILYASRYNRVEKYYREGTINFEKYQIEINRINKALLELIEDNPINYQEKKRRNRLIALLILSGLFADWNKVSFVIRALIGVLISIVCITIGIKLLNPKVGQSRPTGFEMIYIDGGSYVMGSSENEKGRDGDECQHSVKVRTFSIGKYEVTQADWREVMGEDPSQLYNKGCDNCPVESVSWNDIQVFLKKLNASLADEQKATPYRLPKEEEWEFAARGGKKSKGYIYSGSNNINEVTWWHDDKFISSNYGTKGSTHPVGQLLPNELGIYDMSGNVYEFCQDFYISYPGCSARQWGEGSRTRRGGNWAAGFDACRIAHRSFWPLKDFPSDDRQGDIGFRLARDSQ